MRNDSWNRMELPYPWTAGDGLARVLDDPSLWTDVFTDSLLLAPLAASLRRIRRTHPRSIGDATEFGAGLCEVLRRPNLRRQMSEDLRAHATPERRGDISLSGFLGFALLQHLPFDRRRLGPPLPQPLDAALAAQIMTPAPDEFGPLLQALPPEALPAYGPLLAAALSLVHRSAAADYAAMTCSHTPAAHVLITAIPVVVPLSAPEPIRRPARPVRRSLAVVRTAAGLPQRKDEPVTNRITDTPASVVPAEVLIPAPASASALRETEALRAADLCTALANDSGAATTALLTIEALSAAISTLGGPPDSDPAQAVHTCLGEDLDALVVALWHLDEQRAIDACARVPQDRRLAALAGCSFSQIQQAATAGQDVAVAAAAALLVAALQSDDPESLEYLDPCLAPLPPACVEFLMVARIAARRGELGEALLGLLRRPDGLVDAASAGLVGRRVRERVAGTPGMSGHFHRLRMTAHRKYIAPLAPFATDDLAGPALDCWLAAGTLEEKLTACITDQPDGVRLGLESVHVEKTRQYLQEFEHLLRDWAQDAAPPVDAVADDPLSDPWDALRRAAPRSPTCEWLVQVVERACDVADRSLPPEIGRRWQSDAGSPFRARHASLSPLRLHSWIARVRGQPVPLALFVADGVRSALSKGPRTLAEAVGAMLEGEDFRAARSAADGTVHADEVGAAIDRAATALRGRYAQELTMAEAERRPGDELDESLAILDEAFAADELDDADEILKMLANQTRSVQRHRDPTRAPAIAFLRLLGQPVADDEHVESLQQRVNAQRELHAARRWHIDVLRRAADDTTLSGPLRRASAAQAEDLDQPRKWPTEQVAEELHDDLEELFRYVRGQLRDDSADAQALAVAVTDRLASLVNGAQAGDRTLTAIVVAIREYRSLTEILRRVDPRHASSSRPRTFARAYELYCEEKWQLARDLLVAAPPQDDDDDHVLRACVELAHCLWANSALDVDWLVVQRHARWLRDNAATPEVRRRATRLTELSGVIQSVMGHRLVDELAGAGRSDAGPAHAALLILLLQLRQAELCRGASEAVTAALALPEQIFRVWALWALDLDYAHVPVGEAHLWQIVAREWDPRREVVFRPPPPGPFPSFRCFALFVQARLLNTNTSVASRAPERSFGELQRTLGMLRIRNDGAHASFRPSVEQRRQFFALIHRWLGRLFEVCPGGGGSSLRDELSGLLGPLARTD